MRTRAALFLCLLPSLATAQTAGTIAIAETSDTQDGGQNDGTINIAECTGVGTSGATLTPTALNLTWLLSTVPVSGTTYRLYATTQQCPAGTSAPPATDIVNITTTDQPTLGNQNGSWPPTGNIQAITDILTPLGVSCAVSTTVTNVNLCVSVFSGSSPQDVHAGGTLVVDTRLPATPTITSVEPGDSALTVHWTAGAGGPSVTYFTVAATPVAPDATHVGCSAGGAPNGNNVPGAGVTQWRLEHLTNGACYDVTVSATSTVLNTGVASAPVPGVPVPVDDFWRYYVGKGGREQGGCGGSAGLLALLALAPLAPRLRRRRP